MDATSAAPRRPAQRQREDEEERCRAAEERDLLRRAHRVLAQHVAHDPEAREEQRARGEDRGKDERDESRGARPPRSEEGRGDAEAEPQGPREQRVERRPVPEDLCVGAFLSTRQDHRCLAEAEDRAGEEARAETGQDERHRRGAAGGYHRAAPSPSRGGSIP